MTYDAKWYFLRWAACVAYLADGLVGTLTGGFVWPSMGLRAENKFLSHASKLYRSRFGDK